MAEEAYECFRTLLENVPTWIADLEGILDETTARRNEIVSALPASGPSSFLAKLRAMSRSSTLRTRRSRDALRSARPEGQNTSSNTAIPSQRPPRPSSVLSASDSALRQVRGRRKVPVYYDGGVQKQFEDLVRVVGASRNTLRKGRMGAKLDGLARSGSSSSSASDVSSDEGFGDAFNPKRLMPKRSPLAAFRKQDGSESFDQVDSILDRAQVCCEKAAHQALRDGDCRQEIQSAKEQLANARQLLESELPVWQKKADKAAIRRRRSEERLKREEADVAARELAITHVATLNVPSDTGLAADLEADDTDDNDEPEISLSSLRLPPKRQPYRPPHVMAAAC